MKIYVVTKGSYSDYHIITATTDGAKANAIAEKFSNDWDKAEVEIYDDAEIYLKTVWFVRFDKTGNVSQLGLDDSEFSYEKINKCGFDVNKCVFVHVQADDEVTAIKIAAEQRMMFLARKEGIV